MWTAVVQNWLTLMGFCFHCFDNLSTKLGYKIDQVKHQTNESEVDIDSYQQGERNTCMFIVSHTWVVWACHWAVHCGNFICLEIKIIVMSRGTNMMQTWSGKNVEKLSNKKNRIWAFFSSRTFRTGLEYNVTFGSVADVKLYLTQYNGSTAVKATAWRVQSTPNRLSSLDAAPKTEQQTRSHSEGL